MTDPRGAPPAGHGGFGQERAQPLHNPISKTERTLFRYVVGSIGAFVLLVLLIWGGSGIYQHWRERHVLRRAAAYLSGGDVRAAALSAQRAYQLDPESVAAARMLAEIDEAAGNRSALDWRRRAVQLAPNSPADQIALAECALKFEEIGIATKALTTVSPSAQTAAYHACAGRLEEARGRPAEAREHWAKAVQAEPGNAGYQVRLATVSLILPDPAVQQKARETLEKMSRDPAQRAAATRALIADAAKRRNAERVLELARELEAFPEASFQDALLYLDILRQLRRPEFTAFLTTVEEKAVTHPADLALLVSWMNKSQLSALALNYTKGLDPELLKQWPVPMALADSYLGVGDWPGLATFTEGQSWSTLDFLRRAYLSRALREQRKTVAGDREWAAAIKETANQPRLVAVLARTVIQWRWIDEAVVLLWSLAKDPAERDEALSALYRYYSETGDTGGLYRTVSRLVEAHPDDLVLQNNLAQLGLLLDAEPERARKMAADLYQKKPDDPGPASTFAFSLFKQGNAAGAVHAMARLTEEQLRVPALSAYYGIFLVAAGEAEKARPYLAGGIDAPLMPEERSLFDQAQSKVAEPSPSALAAPPP